MSEFFFNLISGLTFLNAFLIFYLICKWHQMLKSDLFCLEKIYELEERPSYADIRMDIAKDFIKIDERMGALEKHIEKMQKEKSP